MINTINDVVRAREEKYELKTTNKNRDEDIGFLERQLNTHPNYDLNKRNLKGQLNPFPYLNLMRDKLLLFSYLTGETPIIAGYKDHEVKRRIGWYTSGDKRLDGSIVKRWELKPIKERKKDLYLLRPSDLGCVHGNLEDIEKSRKTDLKKTDEHLFSLYNLFQVNHSRDQCKDFWPNWSQVIDELGKGIVIVKYFGQKITYEMVKKCESPNPLTFNHGGDRYNKNFRDFNLSMINA